jgi:predicted enzyme related to lactoylglutathione lyase
VQQPSTPAPVVYFDIAGPKPAELQRFYADVFGWHADAKGQMNVPITSPVPASIRQDPTEKRIYIGVDNVTAKLEQIKARGGTIDAPRFEVKGVVVLGLFKDPAGNPMGLIELENGKPKIP